MEKTNAIRLLDSAKLNYKVNEYDNTITNGEEVAQALNLDANMVFKTLVTLGSDNNHYVFVIPVNNSLNLKKAAKACNVKWIEMIKQKELLPLTGYIHGGCSPLGMKKQFKTIINDTAQLFDEICFSGGKIGLQIQMSPFDLANFINASFVDIVE